MPMLTYQALQTLVDPGNNHHLEFVNVDVRRLHDERHEVQYGDEVALVASFTARITAEGQKKLKKLEGCRHLAAGDELIVVGNDAEPRSRVVELDNDGVTQWIADHYEFTFLLNGREHSSFRELAPPPMTVDPPPPVAAPPRQGGGAAGNPTRNNGSTVISSDRRVVAVDTVERPERNVELGLTRYPVGREVRSTGREFGLPWLRRLNTAALDDDLVNIDVRIEERLPPPASGPVDTLLLINRDAKIPFENAKIEYRIEVTGKYTGAADLDGKVFRLPLRSECGAEIELALTVTGVLDPEPAEPFEPGAAMTMTKAAKK